MRQDYAFVFIFVWMRGTLPRVRIDQLMDFAWKWLLPASLLNLFVTAAAIVDRHDSIGGRRDEPRPRPRHRQGHGPDPAPLLRAQGHDQVPGGAARPPPKFRGRLQLLYDEWGTLKCETCFQCAQACPIECIDMGGMDTRGRYHVHWGAPETYGERREESALRRSGRPVPDPAYRPSTRSTCAAVDAILEDHDHDPS